MRERGAQVDSSLYIGRKRNSNQSINPIQDSGWDPAGSGEMSSSTMLLLLTKLKYSFKVKGECPILLSLHNYSIIDPNYGKRNTLPLYLICP